MGRKDSDLGTDDLLGDLRGGRADDGDGGSGGTADGERPNLGVEGACIDVLNV